MYPAYRIHLSIRPASDAYQSPSIRNSRTARAHAGVGSSVCESKRSKPVQGYCQESSASGPEDRGVDKCQRLHALTSQLIWRKTDMRREAPDALGASYLGLLARLLADDTI